MRTPARLSPPRAPRPFYQMARRDVRLYGNTLQGLRGAVAATPWYNGARRRPAVTAPPSAMRRARDRRYWAARPALCYDYNGEVW